MSSPTSARDRFDLGARLTRDRVLLAAIALVWAWLYLRTIGQDPIRTWDESRYVVPSMHMVEGASWLDPQLRVNTHDAGLDSQIRLQKPPLLYWLQATAMTVLGVTEFAARLPSALATLGIAGLAYHVGRETYDRRAGFAGALVLLAFPGMLYGSHGGVAAVPDATLSLFGGAFVWLTWRGRENPTLLVPAGICAGLAVMTKGVAAGSFVIVLLPVVLVRYRSYLTGWTVAGAASTVAVALPWHLYAYLTYGDQFVREYFVYAVTNRVQGETTARSVEPLVPFLNYPYVKRFIEAVLPPYQYGLPLFALGIAVAFALVWWFVGRDGLRDHASKVLLCWWVVAVPVTFMVGGGNQPWYLMPMYMPGAVLLGMLAATLADGTLRTAVADALERVSPGAAASLRSDEAGERTAATAAAATGGSGRPSDSDADAVANGGRRSDAGSTSPSSTGPGLSADVRGAVFPGACLVLVLLFAAVTGPAIVEPYDPEQKDIGTTVADEVPADETVYVWLEHDEPPRSLMALDFYADRDLEKVEPERLWTDGSIRYAIVPYEERNSLEREHRVIATGPENDIHVVEFTE